MGLRPLACWDCGFETCRGHGYLSLVSVVCFQVEVSASGWLFVQRRPTECSVSECDREASIMRPWPTRGCAPWGKKEAVKDYTQFWLFKLTNYVAAVHISYIFVIKYSDVTIKIYLIIKNWIPILMTLWLLHECYTELTAADWWLNIIQPIYVAVYTEERDFY